MNPIFHKATLALVLLGFAAVASAAEPKMASSDRTFLNQAAIGGMAEVELGKLAQDKAESAEVKRFAEHMVQDHGKANEELGSVAQDKGVNIPQELDRSHKAKADKLAKLSGAEFDKAYMKQMVQDHKKTVADFRKAAKGAKDPAVKRFAAEKLPKLEEHLEMAQATEQAVRGGKRAKTAMRSAGGAKQ